MLIKHRPLKTFKTLFACAGLASLATACAANSADASQPTAGTVSQADEMPLIIDLKRGELLSIISVISEKGEAAEMARAQYYQRAFPLAEPFGLKREGQLKVLASPIGAHKSEAIILFSWPSKSAELALEADPAWPEIKALRPQAWHDLRIFTDELESDLTLTFAPDKTYTLAMAWIDQENPNDYDLYMENIRDAVSEVGGRFVYKMFDPKFESHKLEDGAPGQVTLVEWDSPQGLSEFQKSEGFKSNANLITSGTTRFEILVLSTS